MTFVFSSVALAANMVENGGFETPALSSGSWATYPSGTSGLEWSVDYTNGSYGTGLLEIQNNAAGAPHSGNQLAELDSYHNTIIYQNVPTEQGQTCEITYWWSPRPNVSVNSMESYWNGAALAIHNESGGGTTNWHQASFTRNANEFNPYTLIQFVELGPDDGYGMYLDDVSVECETPPQELCPEGYIQGENPIDSLSIPCAPAASYITSSSLTGGEPYVFEASGTCNWRTPGSVNGYLADPEYWLRNDAGGVGWIKMNPGSIAIWNGAPVNIDWGDYNDSHIYPISYTPLSSGTMQFYFYDDIYSDNSGSLNLDIYACAPECTPSSEVCDGVDNDCDSQIDEDLTVPTQSCSEGIGQCSRSGTQTKSCNGVSGWSDWSSCSAVQGEPTEELCNALDDNCDGIVDDGTVCQWSCLEPTLDTPSSMPGWISLGTNRWIYIGEKTPWNGWLTTKPKGNGPSFVPTLEDTHNCSCSQILTWLHTNLPDLYGEMNGHWKYGCSQSAIKDFMGLADEIPYTAGDVGFDSTWGHVLLNFNAWETTPSNGEANWARISGSMNEWQGPVIWTDVVDSITAYFKVFVNDVISGTTAVKGCDITFKVIDNGGPNTDTVQITSVVDDDDPYTTCGAVGQVQGPWTINEGNLIVIN